MSDHNSELKTDRERDKVTQVKEGEQKVINRSKKIQAHLDLVVYNKAW